MATAKKPAEPLTAAQLEVVKQLVADRQAKLLAEVNAAVATALAPVNEAIGLLAQGAIKFGDSLALRAASGKLLSARGGGPSVDEEVFVLVAKGDPNAHESFRTERGQG